MFHLSSTFVCEFGTPGETRTHYLTLRRRTLYPGELRGHKIPMIVTKKRRSVNTIPHIFHLPYHILSRMERRRERECAKQTTVPRTLRICCTMRMRGTPANGRLTELRLGFFFIFPTIFQFLLYTLPPFGYNITDNRNLWEMRDHTYEY